MALPTTLVLTLRDGKGSDAQTLIHLANQDVSTLAELLEAARLHQINVDALTDGQIVRCGLVIDVPLDGGLKSTPGAASDVEAGATFIFQSDGTFTTKFFIPTFDESKILPGLADVDTADSDVSDLIDDIIAGYDGVDVQDARGDDVTAVLAAYEDFHKSRV